MHTYKETTLREFVEFYKSVKYYPANTTFRLRYRGRTIFLSSCGNKSLEELGITHRSFVTVSEVKPLEPATVLPKKAKSKEPKNGKKKGGNNNKKSKKKRNDCIYESNTMQDKKVEHSRRLSLVFEEADATFKEIRRSLINLSLEKTLPKDKSASSSKGDADIDKDTPSTEGTGGKAGKIVFPLLVGEVENLYSSGKKTKHTNLRKLSIDLHGRSRSEAMDVLDEALPSWVDTAMAGEHPFIVKVDVVCGAGNQVLAESVEKWIRAKKQVANRPKSFC